MKIPSALALPFLLLVFFSTAQPAMSQAGASAGGAAQPVVWQNAVGVSVSGSSLTKTGPEGWNAGASSVQTIGSGDGYVEFTAANISARMVGLSNGDSHQAHTDIDFAIYPNAVGLLEVWEAGNFKWGGSISYVAGDRFRVAVEGGAVKYYKISGGVATLLYTSAATPTYPLLVDTSLYYTGAQIADTVITASQGNVTWQNLVGVSASGSNLTKTGPEGWNAGASSTQSIQSGDCSVEFTASNLSARMVGLSNGDSHQSHTDIDFAIYPNAVGMVEIWEAGNFKWGGSISYVVGDRFRVAVERGVVNYYKINGGTATLLYTSTATPTYPLLVDTSLYYTGAQISDTVISAASKQGTWDGSSTAQPSNFLFLTDRIVGVDVWRANLGGLRNVGSGTMGISGVFGTVSKAYLYWHGVSTNCNSFADSSVVVNNVLVSGSALGASSDNNWYYGEHNLLRYACSEAFRADITHLVGQSPNKNYTLRNFGTGNFNPNGAAILIFYNDSDPNDDYDVTMLSGNDSNLASAYDPGGWDANFGPIRDYGVVGNDLDLFVADGQSYVDQPLFLNNILLRPAGLTWQGTAFPSVSNGPENNGNLWDMDFDYRNCSKQCMDDYIYNVNGLNNVRLTMPPHGINTVDNLSLVLAVYYAPMGRQSVHINNPRIGGDLENSTRNALVGADVQLSAALRPDSLSGGNFNWSVTGTGSHQFVSSPNSSATTLRFFQPGSYGVTVRYVRNGVTISSSMTVNVIMPTLSVLRGDMVDVDQVTRGLPCSDQASSHAKYSLGCASFRDPNPRGMVFNTTATIPAGPYLTDLSQSGIKFRHFGSEYSRRKRDVLRRGIFSPNPREPFLDGRDECLTGRSSRDDVESGWQTDGGQIFAASLQPLPRFSAGNSISTRVFDLPSQYLDVPPPASAGNTVLQTDMMDVQSLDVFFEMFVYYYTGDPQNPNFQQPMRLADHNTAYSKIPWRWGGQAAFDAQNSPTVKYVLQFSNTTPLGQVPAVPTNTMRSPTTDLQPQIWRLCPDSPPTGNALDSVRFFVRDQYRIILKREPENGGWDAWTSVITRCGFDLGCIHEKRKIVARDIFNSPEHLSKEPALGNNPFGSPAYNEGFVRLCYMTYMGRMPQNGEEQGWVNHLNATGDYAHIIGGFINSPEYRGRDIYNGVVGP